MRKPVKSSPSKPLCYRCVHRGTLVGDRHSRCEHPAVTSLESSDLGIMLSMPSGNNLPERTLGVGTDTITVRFDQRGIDGGWATWPKNFDPIWLEWCTGFADVDSGPLKLYTTDKFDGRWSVGAAAIVLAINEEDAERLLAAHLEEEHGLELRWNEDDPSKRFEEIPLDGPRAIVLHNGDY